MVFNHEKTNLYRRFLVGFSKESTIIKAFRQFFFDIPEVTKIGLQVLPNLMVSN